MGSVIKIAEILERKHLFWVRANLPHCSPCTCVSGGNDYGFLNLACFFPTGEREKSDFGFDSVSVVQRIRRVSPSVTLLLFCCDFVGK